MRTWFLFHWQCFWPLRLLSIRFYLHRNSMHRIRHSWLLQPNSSLHFFICKRHCSHMILSIQFRVFFCRIVCNYISRMNSFDQNVFTISSNKHFWLNYFALSYDLIVINSRFFIWRYIAKLNIVYNCWFRVIHQNHCYIMPNCIFGRFKYNIMINCWILISNLDLVQECMIFQRNTHIVDCRGISTFAFRSR